VIRTPALFAAVTRFALAQGKESPDWNVTSSRGQHADGASRSALGIDDKFMQEGRVKTSRISSEE